ncbi:MAG: hypothetical protein J6U58_03260 [Bacteroidaceae bacterium]|nr:hypothetical protein [Bacteroidaceae bacterium]
MQQFQFDKLTDEEMIQRLIATPVENRLHDYFFRHVCHSFLLYISQTLYNENSTYHLTGEFYEYISNDNWKVLRMWKGENGCSLCSYLSTCTMRYFSNKIRIEKKRSEIEFVPSTPEFIEYIQNLPVEEYEETGTTWQAFNMLQERDQDTLRLLIIEEKDAMSAAPEIWKHLNSKKNYKDLPPQKVQNTISMIKHRALISIQKNINKLQKN